MLVGENFGEFGKTRKTLIIIRSYWVMPDNYRMYNWLSQQQKSAIKNQSNSPKFYPFKYVNLASSIFFGCRFKNIKNITATPVKTW